MYRRKILAIALFILSLNANAQKWLDQVGKAVKQAGSETAAEGNLSMDSLDFQFAISVNENAGFFDVKQKGEGGNKAMNFLFGSDKPQTPQDIAREKIKTGTGFYDGVWKNYKLAELYFDSARIYLESQSLTNEILYLKALSSLGLVNLTQAKNTTANEYLATTLEMSEKTVGKESAAYVANLNNLAKLHQALGKYNEAEGEFNEALTLSDKVFGEGMQKAILLNNKAMLFQAVGRYDEAADLMKEAMKAASKGPKKTFQSFDNRKFQVNLAFIYQLSGKLPEAEKAFLEIKKVFEDRKQTGNAEYAGLLNQMGILYIQMGKPEKVEELLKKAKAVYKERFTEENTYYAKVTNDLGNFYRMTARYEDAEKQLNKALNIRETLLGTKHPDYVRTQENLAILYWKTGKLEQAYMMYRDVMDKTIDFINQYFPPMSEAEKTSYWDITAPRFQRFYSFAIEASSTMKYVSQDFYDYNLATKALLLNATNKVKEAILKSKNEALIKEYLSWLDQKEQLARLYTLSKEELKQQKINLPELERAANAAEKSLSGKSTEFSAGYSTQKISYKQILGLLNDTEAVVDIIRVRGFAQDFTPDSRYVALILKKGAEMPQLVMMENGADLEKKYAKFYRNAVQQKVTDDYSYEQYWTKIEKELTGKKLIYISPDGVYNQMNLNTLKRPDQDYVVNRYDLVIIGNTKDLIALKARKTSVPKKNAFLLGFPDYGTSDVAALPGTKVEIDGVAKVLKTSGYQVTQVMAKDATEKNVKAVKAPTLVHIATHGYFLQDAGEGEGSVFGVNAESASRNPLLRSGLILAGAGRAFTGGGSDISSNDNGILTAYEAMNLDLEGTNLVILSACETGLGDIKSGEGVYGLQRAFQVAGAEALIMSLWKVDDAATQMLMTNFYNNWIKLGNKQKAFKQAQLQLMAKYKDPYYWGAFVMMGM
ncbi:MAG TPA: CHAT domain-containing protein [Cyclobacteriaceae bacterium]|nr:CHAT domain-containing protein [Cyclobacteriaceae bacterium]HMV09749.1 CHAT domain-containing protein [Cyclobacteriaceae bacterium]HMV88804.1 CHAT domain-containing protein [Cyclobacteriaceae bacterium]HMX02302.1 CHAT domain-containing protein [Cyclobacteriaceae bacterium]HMX51157.1 CHAT domain-containing protein [Cyclobacteriaceae bacterium]